MDEHGDCVCDGGGKSSDDDFYFVMPAALETVGEGGLTTSEQSGCGSFWVTTAWRSVVLGTGKELYRHALSTSV